MKTGRARRSRRQEFPEGELMLAAMVDMMINILLFLLTLYGATSIATPPGDPIQFAPSASREPVRPQITLAVTPSAVFVGTTSVVALDVGGTTPRLPAGAVTDGLVPTVASALQALARTTPPLPGAEPRPAPELLVECDKRVPWSVLGPLLHTAERAGFGVTRFVVRQTGPLEIPSAP